MKLPIYQVDAFGPEQFTGNPAAVIISNEALDVVQMQQIAAENNLSETAFLVAYKGGYKIRWFTPTIEVDLCGHATLAAAFVLFQFYHPLDINIAFYTQNRGTLSVDRVDDLLALNFPIAEFERAILPQNIIQAFGIKPVEVYKGKDDFMLVLENESAVNKVKPDFRVLQNFESRGFIVTACGSETDFVSRFFAPAAGIDEDPVTGSAHTMLTPYWAKVLKKKKLTAFQASRRGGWLQCELAANHVKIAGKAHLYLKGEIHF